MTKPFPVKEVVNWSKADLYSFDGDKKVDDVIVRPAGPILLPWSIA